MDFFTATIVALFCCNNPTPAPAPKILSTCRDVYFHRCDPLSLLKKEVKEELKKIGIDFSVERNKFTGQNASIELVVSIILNCQGEVIESDLPIVNDKNIFLPCPGYKLNEKEILKKYHKTLENHNLTSLKDRPTSLRLERGQEL